MDYVALFVWLMVCVTLGAFMHAILSSALSYKVLRWLSAPGVAVRKFSMSLAALLGGGTVTHANVYDVSERDVAFHADGASRVSKMLVPLAPLFGCAVVLQIVNTVMGHPIDLGFGAPALSSLDAGGAVGFADALWGVARELVLRIVRADWASPALYVLLLFAFSLSLGASVSFDRFRQSFFGVLILVLALATVCALLGVPSGVWSSRPAPVAALAAWVEALRGFIMSVAGMAVVMMLFGMLASVLTGIIVRVYELFSHAAADTGKSGEPEERDEKRQAA